MLDRVSNLQKKRCWVLGLWWDLVCLPNKNRRTPPRTYPTVESNDTQNLANRSFIEESVVWLQFEYLGARSHFFNAAVVA